MTTYTGTQEVKEGLYFNLRKFSLAYLEKRGPLPGTESDCYRRTPPVLLLAAAPLLGLVYVIFLPFIGFAMVAWLLAHKSAQLAAGMTTEFVRVLRPGWEPSLAFLSRSKPAKTTTPASGANDEWAERVEKNLNETDRHA